MGNLEKRFMAIAILATVLFLGWSTVRIIRWYQFDVGCAQYIKRAADANTVELAKENLEKAISFAEKNNLTEGVVSVFFHQPKNDVGYWYKNLTESYKELESIPEDDTSLERTNLLIKLRETLVDEVDSEISVTVPDGISIYPHNFMYFWWGLLSGLAALIFWLILVWFWPEGY